MAKQSFKIEGMSCQHCKAAVTEALEALAGVQSVQVDLETGTAEITYEEGSVTTEQVQAAIEEAGYELIRA